MDHSRISSKWVGVLAGSARIRNVSIPPRFLYCSLIFTCSLVAQATAWLFVFNSYSYEALLPHFSSISLHLWCIFYIAPQHRKTIDEIAVELRRGAEKMGRRIGRGRGTLDNLQGIIDGMGEAKTAATEDEPNNSRYHQINKRGTDLYQWKEAKWDPKNSHKYLRDTWWIAID